MDQSSAAASKKGPRYPITKDRVQGLVIGSLGPLVVCGMGIRSGGTSSGILEGSSLRSIRTAVWPRALPKTP